MMIKRSLGFRDCLHTILFLFRCIYFDGEKKMGKMVFCWFVVSVCIWVCEFCYDVSLKGLCFLLRIFFDE